MARSPGELVAEARQAGGRGRLARRWRPSVCPLQIVLPWLTTSEKPQELTRALYTVAHMLRFVCNFPELLASAGGGAASPAGVLAPWDPALASEPQGLAGPLPWGPTERVLLPWSGRGGAPQGRMVGWRWGWWWCWGEAASGTTRG